MSNLLHSTPETVNEPAHGGPPLVSCGPGIWFAKGIFFLGDGQTTGLTYTGLRARLLEALDKHPEVLQAGGHNESTPKELEEERIRVQQVRTSSSPPPFALDTTMAVVEREGLKNGSVHPKELILISPVPARAEVVRAVSALGKVVAIVAPNVQHWLFVRQWARHFPEARVFRGPDAPGDALGEKLHGLSATELIEGEHQLSSSLEQRLLRGALLCMNEFVFLHRPSGTLIASDGFYGGYPADAPAWQQPGWFGRIWFKLTKGGTFRRPTLPVYRTARVASGGDPDALAKAVVGIARDWPFTQIVFAHGTVPYRDGAAAGSARDAFRAAWFDGCALHGRA